ncbi:WD domain, G-beta repeat [Musa troglodytarum]|uniref:WD domain, G-beta repeat n=1 Tax=Musa troglodytarum TaxID=320322 RepID=A0A9E7ETQ6_9LILI|nr:WD domain, G-beta repeat [Musa troglodytarum]
MPFASSSSRPRFLRREADSDEESETSSSGGEDDLEEDFPEEAQVEEDAAVEVAPGKRKKPPPITISLKRVCKVCKQSGHEAGFRGATYIDCPRKPCFLCKTPGHTTMFCPHRVAMEHGVIPAPARNTKTPLDYIFMRQLKAKTPKIKPVYVIPDQVDCGLIRFHSRRVTCLEFHPTKSNILLSGDKFLKLGSKKVMISSSRFSLGNDAMAYTSSSDGTVSCTDMETGIGTLLLDLNPDGWNARIWDARRLGTESCLASLAHGRVVNSAYFSPLTGNKILTTSQDNRIRVWDSIFGNLEHPSREIVHSHDFNRHLTPFRAEWDPKDPSESLVVIGRYISENYDGVALHPIDFIDTSTGKLVAEVMDTDVTTISPVNKLHPQDHILASGSSRTLLIWKARQEDWEAKKQPEKRPKQFIFRRSEKKSNGKFDSDSGGDSDDSSNGKKRKAKKCQGKHKKLVW